MSDQGKSLQTQIVELWNRQVQQATTTTTVGEAIDDATEKTTIVDADKFAITDSEAANILKKISWANLKVAIDIIYFNKTTETLDDITAGATNIHFTTTKDSELADSFKKTTDDLDDITAGTTNKHFTDTEKTKLTGIEENADVTTATKVGELIWDSSPDATPNDGDRYALSNDPDKGLRHTTWANIKATLKTYFDTLYPSKTEDIWTPSALNYDGVMTVNFATYEKIGRQVTVRASVTFDGTADGSQMTIQGLPFNHASANSGTVGIAYNSIGAVAIMSYNAAGRIAGSKYDGTSTSYTSLGTSTVQFTYTYYV